MDRKWLDTYRKYLYGQYPDFMKNPVCSQDGKERPTPSVDFKYPSVLADEASVIRTPAAGQNERQDMTVEKILTITVPSYNVEKFLEKTLDSFLAEEVLGELEVLIVDDGSKDRTAQIGKKIRGKLSGNLPCYLQGERWAWLHYQPGNPGSQRKIF